MNNKQVAEAWAKQKSTHARGSNFFFEGDTLYSYNKDYILAKIFICGAIVRYTPYSHYTKRHKSLALSVLTQNNIKHTEAENPDPKSMDDHYQNLDDLFEELQDALDNYHRRREGSSAKEGAKWEYNRIAKLIHGYCEMFGITNHLIKINGYYAEELP